MNIEDLRDFTEEEVADVFKNKNNISYLFELNGLIKRIFSSAQKNVLNFIFQRCSQKRKKTP